MVEALIALLGGILLVGGAYAVAQLVSVWAGAQLVSTPAVVYPLILRLARFKRGEQFLELGCGLGGVTASVARQTKAQAIGLDISWFWVYLARLIHRRSRATFQVGSVDTADLRSVDVVYCYLLPLMLKRLQPKLETELKPGSRVITYGFPLPNQKPNRAIHRSTDHGPLYLYEY